MNYKRLPRIDYEEFHKIFGGAKTRDEIAQEYQGVNLPWKNSHPKRKTRKQHLEKLLSYYYNTQYDNRTCWTHSDLVNKVPLHKRKPRLIIPYPYKIAAAVSSGLFGEGKAPVFTVLNSDKQEKLEQCLEAFSFNATMGEATQMMAVTGAVLIRFFRIEDRAQTEIHPSTSCYPVFNDKRELEAVLITYVYVDPENGKLRWYRLYLDRESDTLYSNPEYIEDEEPVFRVIKRVEHGLGFVQATWLVNGFASKNDYDGHSLIEPYLSIFDDINYQLSGQSDSILYNTSPQMTMNLRDESAVEDFEKSVHTIWQLGIDGKAGYLETDLSVCQQGKDHVRMLRDMISDISGIPAESLDQKVKSSTSGVALRQSMQGYIALIQKIRSRISRTLVDISGKMCHVFYRKEIMSGENIKISWYDIVQDTPQDVSEKSAATQLLIQNKIISRKTAMQYFAAEYSIDDVEEEIKRIEEENEIEIENQMQILGANRIRQEEEDE